MSVQSARSGPSTLLPVSELDAACDAVWNQRPAAVDSLSAVLGGSMAEFTDLTGFFMISLKHGS